MCVHRENKRKRERKRETKSAYLGGCKRHNREGPSECRDLLDAGQVLQLQVSNEVASS